jgi:dephospho-CoA kinase
VPPAVQLERLRDRDGLDDLAAQRRLVAQLPIDDKRARATWIIDNTGRLDTTVAQIETWWRAFVADR